MHMQQTIFVVDDSDVILNAAEEGLGPYYNVLTMPSGMSMFSMLRNIRPSLILLDIAMPEINGFQTLEVLKKTAKYANIPVMFLTGMTDEETKTKCFELGAVDFITKPFSVPVLANRIKLHLNMHRRIQERSLALEHAHRSLMSVLADIVESRDKNTGGHIDRTTRYIKLLIQGMLDRGVYASELEDWNLTDVAICAALHDVGKIAIPDVVLNKPGKLTYDEFELIKTHAAKGTEIINKVINRTGEDKFLYPSRVFAGFHHENWDGSGYPHGLKGRDIPLGGRIMAVVDVYDALVSERPYKKAFTDEEAVSIISADSGKKFDPAIVDVFLALKDEFASLRSRLGGAV